jgi:SAM-dependent methyltransferase
VMWGPEVAAVYDATSRAAFDPAVLDPMVDALAELAGDGPVLELAIGTGRVALPLRARGLEVHGIELSPHMVAALRSKPDGADVPVTVGDMTTTRIGRGFALVYLVANTIMNVTTQEEQLAVFANAAAHLRSGGRFVIDVIVPQLRRAPLSELGRIFAMEADHVGIETFDDPVQQVAWSRHWMDVDGRVVRHEAPYRYVWPSELDLMGRIAGLRLEHRWSGWNGEPFTGESERHVSVWTTQPDGA